MCSFRVAGRTPPTTAQVAASLRDAFVVLPPVRSLVATITKGRLAGAPLLSLLSERVSASASCPPCDALRRLAWYAHGAALRQLAAWCASGELVDPAGECFIARTGEAVDDEAGDGGAAAWHSTHGILLAALPPWMELHTAEQALFIGRAVQTLRRSEANGVRASPVPASLHDTHPLSPDALRRLLTAPSLRGAVEAAVGAARRDAGVRLWALLSTDCRLGDHFAALRAYALCGRGDVWHVLVEDGWGRGGGAPPSEHLAASLLSAAGARAGASDDPLFASFRFVWDPPLWTAWPGTPSTGGAWGAATLVYSPPPPLGCVFTPAALSVYCAAFSHLLALRMARAALDGGWVALVRTRPRAGPSDAPRPPRRAVAPALPLLRCRVAAALCAWEAYAQRDVIEPAFCELRARTHAASEWGEAAAAHAAFLSTLREELFLELRPFGEALSSVLRVAQRVAAAVTSPHARGDELRPGGGAGAAGAAAAGAALEAAELGAAWDAAAAKLAAVLRAPVGGNVAARRLVLTALQ